MASRIENYFWNNKEISKSKSSIQEDIKFVFKFSFNNINRVNK